MFKKSFFNNNNYKDYLDDNNCYSECDNLNNQIDLKKTTICEKDSIVWSIKNLEVTDNLALQNLEVKKNLCVQCKAIFDELIVNKFTINGLTSFKDLSVCDLSVNCSLFVNGETELSGNVLINNDLSVNGTLQVGNTSTYITTDSLDVSDNFSINKNNNNLIKSNLETKINNDLFVNGETELSGNVLMNNDLSVNGTLQVDNNLLLNNKELQNFNFGYLEVTNDISLSNEYSVIEVNNSSNAITIQLPQSTNGKIFKILILFNGIGNDITISTTGGDVIFTKSVPVVLTSITLTDQHNNGPVFYKSLELVGISLGYGIIRQDT